VKVGSPVFKREPLTNNAICGASRQLPQWISWNPQSSPEHSGDAFAKFLCQRFQGITLFPAEFKRKVAELVLKQNYSYIVASLSLGVGESALRHWIDKVQLERQGVTPQSHSAELGTAENSVARNPDCPLTGRNR